jgi:hypothetical protein
MFQAFCRCGHDKLQKRVFLQCYKSMYVLRCRSQSRTMFLHISLLNPKRKYSMDVFSWKGAYSASILSFKTQPLGLFLSGVLHVTMLQSLCVHIALVQKWMGLFTCCCRSRTVPGATSARCLSCHSVAKRVCPHCCKSVCAYMLQSEPYSARGHFCQVVCDYGMVLIWAIHESKVVYCKNHRRPRNGNGWCHVATQKKKLGKRTIEKHTTKGR